MKSILISFVFLSMAIWSPTQTTPTTVNPDGTHTTIHHTENTSTQINPDGTHTIIHHPNNINEKAGNGTPMTIQAKVSKRKKKKILQILHKMEQGIIKNTPIEIAKLYSDDGYVINPRGIEAQGRQQLNEYWMGMKDRASDWVLENHMITATLAEITQSEKWNNLEKKPSLPEAVGIDLSKEKNLLYQLGTSNLSFKDKKTGEIRVSVVDFLIVWRKKGKAFEIFVDTYQ